MKMYYFICGDLSSSYMGYVRHVEGILLPMHKQGWEITLFSCSANGTEGQPRYPYRQEFIFRPDASIRQLILEQWRILGRLLSLKNSRPDLFYIRSAISMITPYVYARAKGIPYVVEVNGLQQRFSRHPRLSSIAKHIERWALAGATGIFTTTDHLRAGISAEYGIDPGRIEVIPMGVEPELLQRPAAGCERAEHAALVYVGHLDARQGVDTMLRALELVCRTRPEVKLTIVGGGAKEAENEYRELASSLRLDDCVDFAGPRYGDELGAILESSDVAIAPYFGRFGKDIPMGSPTKMFTYLAAGKVTVASRLPTMEEFRACQAVLFAEADDAESFASAILKALALDPSERQRLGESARTFAENFTWDRLAERTMNHIREWLR